MVVALAEHSGEFFEFRRRDGMAVHHGGEPVLQRIAAGYGFASRRARSTAFSGIAPVCSDFALGTHSLSWSGARTAS